MVEPGIRQLRQPTQCVLWDKPQLVGQPPVKDMFETVETFVDTSHLERTLFKCRECGQLYFYEYYEHVDFGDGNDREYLTYIPVEAPEDIAAMKEGTVFDLMRFFPRLQLQTGMSPAWVGK
jgi:hypothetical protein